MTPKTKIILNYLYIGIGITGIRYLDKKNFSWGWLFAVLLFVGIWAAIGSLRDIAYREGLNDRAAGWREVE